MHFLCPFADFFPGVLANPAFDCIHRPSLCSTDDVCTTTVHGVHQYLGQATQNYITVISHLLLFLNLHLYASS